MIQMCLPTARRGLLTYPHRIREEEVSDELSDYGSVERHPPVRVPALPRRSGLLLGARPFWFTPKQSSGPLSRQLAADLVCGYFQSLSGVGSEPDDEVGRW
jgi:hypothetical protein